MQPHNSTRFNQMSLLINQIQSILSQLCFLTEACLTTAANNISLFNNHQTKHPALLFSHISHPQACQRTFPNQYPPHRQTPSGLPKSHASRHAPSTQHRSKRFSPTQTSQSTFPLVPNRRLQQLRLRSSQMSKDQARVPAQASFTSTKPHGDASMSG